MMLTAPVDPNRILTGELFQKQLWFELTAAGLIPEPECYRATCVEAERRGIGERNRLLRTMGLPAWWCSLWTSGLWRTAYGARGILGWGYALTEFFIAPLPLSHAERREIASLGSLVNFIVTFYDTLLDSMIVDDDLLSRLYLESAVRRTIPEPVHWPLLNVTPRRVLAGLVQEFFYRLNTLPGVSQHPDIYFSIRHAIVRMYDAEHQTLRMKAGREPLCVQELRIKSAYPFVVMGLIGWLLVPSIDPSHYWWHLRWLHRLGEFYGWIDDSVDLVDDAASARPNQVMNLLAKADDGPTATAELARQIAGKGQMILAGWQDRVPDQEKLSLTASHSFSACLASWFGSLPARRL
jgi:hypothetical protein